VQRYLNKVSGPLLDRIDLHVEVTPVNYDDLSDEAPQESSAEIRQRVLRARKIQWRRFDQHRRAENKLAHPALHANTEMGSRELRKFCRLDQQSAEMIKRAMNTLGLSARAYDKILKVGRTIADLDNAQMIEARHIAEAIQYRSLDKGEWGG
jgi:magnesium chelatase family protein